MNNFISLSACEDKRSTKRIKRVLEDYGIDFHCYNRNCSIDRERLRQDIAGRLRRMQGMDGPVSRIAASAFVRRYTGHNG